MLLQPEFWRGQQRESRNKSPPVRHMRPRCDIVSTGEFITPVGCRPLTRTDPELIEGAPKSIVLFVGDRSLSLAFLWD